MKRRNKESKDNAALLRNLISFLSDGDRSLEDVKESLREQGIDPDNALLRFRETLSTYGPQRREQGSRERNEVKEDSQSEPVRARETILTEIKGIAETMRGLGAPILVGMRRPEFEGATEGDLETLLKDLKVQLDLLHRKHKNHDE